MQFNFVSLEEICPFVPMKEHLIKDNIVRYHLDPFFAECRAFGRLVDEKKDYKLAVRCYGYAFLPGTVERRIARQFGMRDWNRAQEDEGSPLRAIVKDYIRYKSFYRPRTFATMRKNLEDLNRVGI